MKRQSLLLLGLIPFSATAHDMWFESTPAGYVLQLGHRHSDHGGEKTLPYAASAVKGALCSSDGGSTRFAASGKAPYVVPVSCAAVVVEFSSGYWTETGYGARNEPRTVWGDERKSWLSVEYVKLLAKWHPRLALPLGDGLELSPQDDPLHAVPGGKLRFVLTLAGQPVAGANVAFGGALRGSTGPDGSINLRIRERGPQTVTASREEPSPDGKADAVMRATTLQWEIHLSEM